MSAGGVPARTTAHPESLGPQTVLAPGAGKAVGRQDTGVRGLWGKNNVGVFNIGEGVCPQGSSPRPAACLPGVPAHGREAYGRAHQTIAVAANYWGAPKYYQHKSG